MVDEEDEAYFNESDDDDESGHSSMVDDDHHPILGVGAEPSSPKNGAQANGSGAGEFQEASAFGR